MPTYRVAMTAEAIVEAAIHVEASSEEEAREKAIEEAKNGNVSWCYAGADDYTIDIEYAEEDDD